MLKHDSPEYWQAVTWDRYRELQRVPLAVREEFREQEHLTVSHIVKLAQQSQHLNILDLAGGTGAISEAVLTALPDKANITLVDFNPETLQLAKRHLAAYKNIDFVLLDAYEIGNRFSNFFDIVICLEFLHHVSRLDFLLSQIHRGLKAGGILMANVIARDHFARWERLKYGVLKSISRETMHRAGNLFYPAAPVSIKRAIRQFGLTRIEPLTEDELRSVLDPYFCDVEIISGYYYWFSALKRAPHQPKPEDSHRRGGHQIFV